MLLPSTGAGLPEKLGVLGNKVAIADAQAAKLKDSGAS